ncbi:MULTISPECIES: hypothetical protein [Lysobacter]|uniref:hypothetical protein n=1 Tax=Lysobacter TaxID=68 RepID=UPI001F39D40F|nr:MULTISPECIES: hypothetical protein [Lysobacter]UJB21437.1 hypothetical protein L1A79_10465 [Lysobacter capsici]UJQ29446.1 hypothetical protein L2D09_04400 [Lysobacter gummosus]
MPANTGESSHFSIWQEELFSKQDGFMPGGPDETPCPCMLPLLAGPIVGQFREKARKEHRREDSDPGFFFFFSHQVPVREFASLGNTQGIIVEMRHTLDESLFCPSAERIRRVRSELSTGVRFREV